MAKFNLVDKKIRMGLSDIIKYQIATHCYVNRISVTESDLDCLTTLALSGESDLTEFCLIATEKRIFKSTQSVRNCLVKLEKHNLITKEGKTKKKIGLNPEMRIQTNGNIMINYKFFHIDPQEAQGNTKEGN
jgi:hypothetical protein